MRFTAEHGTSEECEKQNINMKSETFEGLKYIKLNFQLLNSIKNKVSILINQKSF